MNKEKIESIFGKFGIEIKEIKSATNSFNSNVYIITSPDNKRYVLKFCNNEKKMLNESKYMKYLKHYLPVSDVVGTGEYDERYYIIQSFFEGSNKYDEDANQLSDEQVKNIGILLGKLHSCELLEENTNSWITYLNGCLDKAVETLEKVFGNENNNKISKFLSNYINNNITNDYKNSILHMDFRIGNVMFGNNGEIGLIDLESMKNGEYVFDFVKVNRLFNDDKFLKFMEGYNTIRSVENNFNERLKFYSLFDSYTSLWWCANKNQLDSEFYKLNYKIVMEYLDKLNKDGEI